MSDEKPAGHEDTPESEPAETSSGTTDDAASAVPAGARIPRRTAAAPVRRTSAPVAQNSPAVEDDEELPEGAIRRRTAQAPVRKAAPTRKRSETVAEEHDPYGKTSPGNFVKQSAEELKKVVWPTWPQLLRHFVAVLAFVLFFIAFIGLLDYFLGWGLLSLFGD